MLEYVGRSQHLQVKRPAGSCCSLASSRSVRNQPKTSPACIDWTMTDVCQWGIGHTPNTVRRLHRPRFQLNQRTLFDGILRSSCCAAFDLSPVDSVSKIHRTSVHHNRLLNTGDPMKTYRTVLVVSIKLLVVVGACRLLNADVVTGVVTDGVDGRFVKLHDPIGKIGFNVFQNNNLYAFNEVQKLTLEQQLQVAPGEFLPAGTVLDSQMVFFDPAVAQTQIGYVDFAGDIIGVISDLPRLNASNQLLGNPTALYAETGFVGLEENDIATVDPLNPQRLLVDWNAANPGDHVRVLTVSADAPILYGDVNLDCAVDLQDISVFVTLLVNGTYQVEGDIDQNGSVNLADIPLFVEILAGN